MAQARIFTSKGVFCANAKIVNNMLQSATVPDRTELRKEADEVIELLRNRRADKNNPKQN